MDNAVIARALNCTRQHVTLVLKGKRNPNTKTGLQIVNMAAQMYAVKCINDFTENVNRSYKLHKSIDKMKADLIQECKRHETKTL